MTLHLPKYVCEKNLCSFLDLLCQGNTADQVRLDFLNVKHYIPAAITLRVTEAGALRALKEQLGALWAVKEQA